MSSVSNSSHTPSRASYSIRSFDHLMLVKGFSQQLMSNHLKLYDGYVKNCNTLLSQLDDLTLSTQAKAELRRRLGWEFNGMRLHELFFENLGAQPLTSKDLKAEIDLCFGSFENWQDDFQKAASTRGIGWVILCRDPSNGKLINSWINEHDWGYLATAYPLLVMDVWEHAYLNDYQIDRTSYIQAFISEINWNVVAQRLESSKSK